ncbi:hypothetical protein AAF695_01770 [Aerococcus viridans]
MRIQKSLKEYLIDYLIIIILLVIVAVICIIIYAVMSGIAEVSLLQSNLLSFFTSVLPVVLIFTYMDYTGSSFGKKKAYIKLVFQQKTDAKCPASKYREVHPLATRPSGDYFRDIF